MSAFEDYRRILLLIGIMMAVALSVGGVAVGILYQTSFEQQKERLMVTARRQARLIEAVAEFDILYSHDHPQGSKAATLSQIAAAHEKAAGFGRTGEFTLAELVGDRMVYLLNYRHPEINHVPVPKSLPFENGAGEPMRRALSGQSGVIVGKDYRGETVLAAHEPVSVYNLGIVAKIDLDEIREPFVRAGLIVLLLAVAAIVIGAAVFFWIGSPMVRRLLESERELRRARDELEEKVVERTLELTEEVDRRSRAEQAAIEKSIALERSNADLEQYAFVASHDLQEPLRLVSLYVQKMQRKFEGRCDAEDRDYMTFIIDGTARMRDLVRDLLAFSRLHSPLAPDALCDGADALRLARYNLESAIAERQAIIHTGPLPSVRIDTGQLVIVLQNLIGNALKFCPPERVPDIHVEAEKEGDNWRFAVRDNGIGIATEYRERIFGIFQRLHRREDYMGTGIGLALCKRIVEQHGGRIWAEVNPGGGSVFFFTLPAADTSTAGEHR